MSETQGKSFVAALLLCLFLGAFGAHRFYTGHMKTAVAMLLVTLLLGWIGGAIVTGLWALVDLINICIGKFKTVEGADLVK